MADRILKSINTRGLKNAVRGSEYKKEALISYGILIGGYILLQLGAMTGLIGRNLQGQFVPICVYVSLAISLNLVVGISGELSLGHAGFMAVGAFTGAVVVRVLENGIGFAPLRLLIALLISAAMAALAGLIIGLPILGLRGDYLAIVTLAFGEIIKSLINNLYVGFDSKGFHLSMLEDKTNLLEGGKLIIGGPMGIGGIKKISNLTAGFILVMITLIVVFHIMNSRSGRAIMAIRDNRIAAESVGINVTKYKLTVFTISAALAGAAGALFAMNYSTIVANKFDFNTSILVLVFVVLGGLSNMLGSVIAAAALTILPEALRQFSEYRMLVYAIVLILVMLATNNPALRALIDKLKPGRKNEEKEG